ncbi:MAG: glycosyltransferase family 4 protein [Sphingobacteriaceae bacterium]|nr:glycosyltransferase family 4 protein [Sphingobacteriaceae bacterium]
MRILQLCNKAPFPANDGSSIAIYNMARGLYENNAELHLLTINTKKHFKEDSSVPQEFKTKTHYRSVYKDTSPGALGAFLNLFSSKSYFISRFYFKEFEDALIETLQKNTFDVIQLEGLFMAPYIATIKKFSKAKIALRAHNIEHLIWQRHISNESNGLKKAYLKIQNSRLKTYEEEIFTKVDVIVTITDADKDHIHKQFPKLNIVTCLTGVDLVDYEQNVNVIKQENTIFSFGSMDWMPNLESVDWFLNNCWGKINAKHPNCKFIIAGRHMPQKFKTLQLHNVQIEENVINNRDFYSTYDIMLVPLLSGSGLRIKLVEGLAYGKAIVSTSIGAEGIAITKGEHMLIADSAEEFTNAIDRLLSSATEKKNLEQNAKQFAKEHLVNRSITKKLLDHYKKLH